jgi:hypothetical protein
MLLALARNHTLEHIHMSCESSTQGPSTLVGDHPILNGVPVFESALELIVEKWGFNAMCARRQESFWRPIALAIAFLRANNRSPLANSIFDLLPEILAIHDDPMSESALPHAGYHPSWRQRLHRDPTHWIKTNSALSTHLANIAPPNTTPAKVPLVATTHSSIGSGVDSSCDGKSALCESGRADLDVLRKMPSVAVWSGLESFLKTAWARRVINSDTPAPSISAETKSIITQTLGEQTRRGRFGAPKRKRLLA